MKAAIEILRAGYQAQSDAVAGMKLYMINNPAPSENARKAYEDAIKVRMDDILEITRAIRILEDKENGVLTVS